MKNNFLSKNRIVFLVCFLNTNALFANLLKDEDLSEHTYTAVHVWNNVLQGGERVGHAALQIIENNTESLYVSLYPADATKKDIGFRIVEPDLRTFAEDLRNKGSADTIMRLYSLNTQTMKTQFDQNKNKYTLSGKSELPFGDDDPDARSCASMVREVLKYGGIEKLFEPEISALSNFRLVPAATETLCGAALGLAGGAIGGSAGFFYGVFTLNNPLKTAWIGTKVVAKGFSEVPLDWASQHFSMINRGHLYLDSKFVTPTEVATLANDARSLEKNMFPRSSRWG